MADGKIKLSVKIRFDATRGPIKITGGSGEYAGASGSGNYQNIDGGERTAITLNLN